MQTEHLAQNPHLVCVPGWSMHSGVWETLLSQLNVSQSYQTHLIDLPGHGQQNWQSGDFELESLLAKWHQQLPDRAIWFGWSLGGLLSLAMAARYPEKVKKLVLFASTPCFVQQADWVSAMPVDVFETFAASLQQDQQQTLQRFLMLQAKGAEQSRETMNQLATQLSQQAPPDVDALAEGLHLLQTLDLRQTLAALSCPIQFILGQKDNLIPASVVDALTAINPAIKVALLDSAGHAPFISHPAQCQRYIDSFLHD